MTLPRRRSLIWRLYALGVVQLVLLAAAVVLVGYIIRQSGSHDSPHFPPGPPHFPPGPPHGPREHHDGHAPPSALAPLLTFFLSGFLIVGLGAWTTRRFIVEPLRRLSFTARALGAGNLRARTGLDRADELGEVARTFDEMAERVESLLLSEKELLANVSHELRTPLARIRVALDLAAEGDAVAARASLEEIAIDLGELETLIDDVLTATRMELGRGQFSGAGFAIHLEEIAPAVLVQRAEERLRARHPKRKLEVSVPEGLPAIEVDPVLFRRTLDNLLENADKYCPDASRPIALRVTSRPGSRPGEVEVEFEVEDRGIGIAEQDLPLIFTPFFRGERSRARGTGGVGLGLTLAKRIVDAHGGTIEVTSAQDRGTTVRVRMPVRVVASTGERDDAHPS